MIDAIIVLVGSVLAALGWATVERKGRKKAVQERDIAERQIEVHRTVNKADDQIDQRMREAEGDNEARDERLSNPGNY